MSNIQVGDKGGFVFKEPFTAYNDSHVSYECTKLAQITEYLAIGVDPKITIYQLHGIEDSYVQDLKGNETLITLVSNTGRKIELPLHYVDREEEVGIPYHAVSLSVNLGAMPLGHDYTAVVDAIEKTVLDVLGVASNTQPVEISSVEYISVEEHSTLQLLRDGNKPDLDIEAQQTYDELLEEFTIVVEQRDVLVKFIEECMCKNQLLEHCKDKPPTDDQDNDKGDTNGNGGNGDDDNNDGGGNDSTDISTDLTETHDCFPLTPESLFLFDEPNVQVHVKHSPSQQDEFDECFDDFPSTPLSFFLF